MAVNADGVPIPTIYAAYQAVPVGAPASVTTDTVMTPTGFFANDHASQASILRITDTAGLPIEPDIEIPPKATWPLETNLNIFTGLKWGCTGGTLYGQLTGYPTV